MNNIIKTPIDNIKSIIKKSLKIDGKERLSQLEKDYENKLVKELSSKSIQQKRKWMTYNQLVIELKDNFHGRYYKKLQYRLTDEASNPRRSCIQTICELDHGTEEIERLYLKIKGFKN